jgi:MFS family permease
VTVLLWIPVRGAGALPGQAGLGEKQSGCSSLTLAGDAGISLWLTTSADRFGRRRTLLLGALLMISAGIVFILTKNPLLLMAASIIGVISPSGNEIGPFLSVEQAGLTQLIPDRQRAGLRLVQPVGSFARLPGRWQAAGCLSSCRGAA